MEPFISVIIVTYNCPRHLKRNMQSLMGQIKKPDQIIIVDNNSTDASYLEEYGGVATIIRNTKNAGFCFANNQGIKALDPRTTYVLFLNPDAFLTKPFIQDALAFMERPENQKVGALTGMLLGYDEKEEKPTGLYDSTGIFCTPYGKWFDRDQGQPINERLYQKTEEVPALCGALMLCRKAALQQAAFKDASVWDDTFFMYKDDIDLSLRLRKSGWKLVFEPTLVAYHCRGWNKNRSQMSKDSRLASALNEVRTHWRSNAYQCLPYSLLKYVAVKFFNY